MDLDAFFDGFPGSRQLFDALGKELDLLDQVDLRAAWDAAT